MVGKNNQQNKLQANAKHVPHFGLRKLSIGVTSVLLSTLVYLGGNMAAQADTKTSTEPTINTVNSNNQLIGSRVTLKTNQQPTIENQNGVQTLTESKTQVASSQASPVEVPANQDANDNKAAVGKGQAEEHQLVDGDKAKVKISNNQLDETKDNSTLTLITNNFHAGDTYQLYIPKGGISISQGDVSSLSPSFGTTTFDDSNPNYYVITDKFITAGNISQNINLALAANTIPGLTTAGSYEKLTDHAFIIKNGKRIGEFDLKVVGKPFTFSEQNASTIDNVVNHSAGVDLVTEVSPSAAGVITKTDDLTHIKLVYHLPAHYTAKSIDFQTTDKHPQTLAHVDVTAATIAGQTLTLDLSVDANSPLKSLLTDGKAVRVSLTGVYDVPDSAFNKDNLYQTQLHQPTITLTDQNNYSITHDGDPVVQTVLKSGDQLNWGQIVKIDHHYTADYVNKTDGVPGNTVDVDDQHKNEGSGMQAQFTPISNQTIHNVVISLQMPDGINVHSVQINSKGNGIDDLDTAYGIQVTYTDGTTEILSIPDNNLITGQANKAIRSLSVKYATYSPDDDLSLMLNNGDNFTVAKKHANGELVQAGDLLVLQATIANDQLKPATFKTTEDRLTTYKENDQKGIFMAGIGNQQNQTPGDLKAGSISYEACSSGYGNPHFDHPVMYIQMPDNAVWDQSKPLEIQTGGTSFWIDPRSVILTPKSVTTLEVNGHIFLKVDLSDYTDVKDGFSVIVKYNNGIDFLTSTKYSPFMVVADNLDNGVGYVTHPTANNLEADDRATFEALLNQEHIDPNKVSYNSSQSSWYHSEWKINTANGTTVATMTKGNTDSGPALAGTQDINGNDPAHFTVYGSIINANSDANIADATQVINLPSTADGKSEFTPVLTGPVTLTDPNTGADLASRATITYYTDRADLSQGANSLAGKAGLSADQVTDWSQIKAIKVVFNKQPLEKQTTARVTMKMVDHHIYDDVGKTIYATSVIYSTSNHGEDLPQVVIGAATPASAKLTVVGKAQVKTVVHYVKDGVDHYVTLPDKTVTYDEGTQTMKRADFLAKDSDLTTNDRQLLPEHMVLDYAHPTIKNSNATYSQGYPNGTAAFGQPVKYDFDGDAVVFEGKVAEKVSDTHHVTETVHFVKADGTKVADDVVKKSKDFRRTGYKNPFTGEVSWAATTATDTLPVVPSPTISGYQASTTSIPAVTVDPTTNDIEKKVVYTPTKQTINYQIVDDSDHGKVLKADDLASGDSASTVPDSAKTTLQGIVESFLNQGYALGQDYQLPKNFDTNDQDNQTVIVHLLHGTTVQTTAKAVKRTIAYYDKTTGQELPTAVAHHDPQTVNFSQTAVTDAVTNQAIGYNTTGHYTEYTGANGQQVKVYTVDTKKANDAWQTTANSWDQVTNPDLRTAGYEPATDESGTAMPTIAKQTVSATDDDQTVKVYYVEHIVPVNATTKVTTGQPVTDHSPYQWPAKNQFDAKNYQSQSTRQIRYQFTNGTQAADPVTETVTFNRTGKMNLVTGAVTPNNDWQAVSSTIDQGGKTTGGQNVKQYEVVASPVIPGYTADKLSVAATDAVQGKNAADVVVTYAPDQQKLTYTVKDATTGQTLAKQVALPNGTGVSDGAVSDAAKASYQQLIDQYQQKGYVVDAQALPTKYDRDDQVDQDVLITLHHRVQKVTGNDTTVPAKSKLQLADLKKTATLDVKYINHDGTTFTGQKPTNAHQSVTLVGTTYLDLVTGELTNKPIKDQQGNDVVNAGNHNTPEISWSTATTQAVQSPSETGYHPSDNQVPALTIKVDNNATADQGLTSGTTVTLVKPTKTATITRTVTYAKDPTVKVIYVDQDNSNQPIANTGSGVLTGVADQPVDYQTAKTLTDLKQHGYVLVTNGFDPQGTAPKYDGYNTDTHTYTVTFKHATTTVTPDQPKTTKDKLPDNQSKKYPDGVGQDDLNKTVTRTIKLHQPDGTVKTIPQTAKLTRNATVDEVTLHVTPGKWTPGKWEQYSVPTLTGYTPSQSQVPAKDVDNTMDNQVVDITYAPNKQVITYQAIDDNTGKVISGDQPVRLASGVSDHAVPPTTQQKLQAAIQYYLAEGYEQVGTAQVPAHFDHQDNDNQLITLHFKHGLLTVDQQHPGKPGQKLNPNDPRSNAPTFPTDSADLTQTVTRTVKLTVGNGQPQTIATQQVVFSGKGTIDRVTGQWQQPVQWTHQSGEMTAVPIHVDNGYHLVSIDRDRDGQQVKAVTVKATDDDYTVNVVMAKDPTVRVVYVDQDNGNQAIDNTGSGVLTGVAGQAVDYQTAATIAQLKQHGYVLVDNGFDSQGTAPKYDGDNTATHTYTVTLKHAMTMVTPDQPKTPADTLPDNPGQKYPDGVGQSDLNKTVTRLISLHRPNGITDNTEQKVHLTRTATVDEVTGKVTADSDWTTDRWSAYQTPTITGYTPTITNVPKVTVDGQTENQTVDISYTADPQEIDYQVVDDNTGKVISGDQPVHLVSGVSDQGVPTEAHQDLDQVVENYQNHGYVLVSGDRVPNQFDHVDDDNQLITVHVKHATTVVTPDQPKTTADNLPDNPSQHYPTGVGQDDLNKTITRTINLHLPDGSVKTIHQEAHLTRTATIDEVTRQVTYGQWTTADWPVYDVPTISGYTASQTTVPLTKVMSTTAPATVDVYYQAIPQTVSGQSNGSGPSTANASAKQRSQQLPQTGNHDSRAVLGLGVSALLGMMGLLGSQHRQDDK